MKKHNIHSILKLTALLLVLRLLPMTATAEQAEEDNSDWVSFLLICNEGMSNAKGNAGNTLCVAGMEPEKGLIRLMMFTWDTFIDYEGYDVPQKLDMPYRNNGPEEAVKVFNANFGTDISLYMSLNFLNMASLIDAYGGVTVDMTRAERNAMNAIVSTKKEQLKTQAASGILEQIMIDRLAEDNYLEEYGPETHLNGLQAVGYGWLQYDSVYNCCEREMEVVSCLFGSAAKTISDTLVLYTNEAGAPENTDGKRAINLDDMTDEDKKFIRDAIEPIFQMTVHDLTEEQIESISMALARSAYEASRQGVNIFDPIDCMVLPLEAQNEYDIIAGSKGHLIDAEANKEAIQAFLYKD